jgi:hypothetical protein
MRYSACDDDDGATGNKQLAVAEFSRWLLASEVQPNSPARHP